MQSRTRTNLQLVIATQELEFFLTTSKSIVEYLLLISIGYFSVDIEGYLLQTKQTKSLLKRWINSVIVSC